MQRQKDLEYTTYVKAWLSGEITGIKADGVLSHHVRRYLLTKAGNKCTKCGWAKVNAVTKKVPLEIDHRDGDHRNNRPTNLKVLCPCCHALTPTYRALNKGHGRPRTR